MKHIHVVVIAIFVFSLTVGASYGGEQLKRPAGVSGDPAAVLLIDQGIRLFAESQKEQALSSFDMAIQMDPTLSEAYFNAGIVALELGMREKGFSYLTEFENQRPEEGKAFLSGIRNAVTDSGATDAGSGFWEFGLAAVLGSVFIFTAGAYLISYSQPERLLHGSGLFVIGFADGRVFPGNTTYMVYPLLKFAQGASPAGLFSLVERRGHKDWQMSEAVA